MVLGGARTVAMGDLLAGRYELIAAVGHGPTGEVWRAKDRIFGEILAVKVLDPQFSADPGTVDRFRREQHVMTAFLHVACVRVREVITEHGLIALVMELVNGGDVRNVL